MAKAIQKINSRWIIHLNVKAEKYKTFRRKQANIFTIGKDLFNKIQNPTIQKEGDKG